MDYRELLTKYIRHVGESEGVTFLRGIGKPDAANAGEIYTGPFSMAEAIELGKLDDEVFGNGEAMSR